MSSLSETVNVLLTAAQRKVIADLLPKLADRLKLDEKNSRTISFTAKELKSIRQKAEAARSHAETGMIRNSLRHIIDTVTKALEESEGIGSIPASERLYQFKITLLESQPPIWRRIQVKNCTLDKLHEHIQTAMGWTNSHLHQFEIDGERYGDPELLDDGFDDFECVDSTVAKNSEIVPKDGKRFQFTYQYDFGDNWQHEVLFEGCLRAEKGQRYPLCVEGERNCPPEDVGGVWGYAEFLEAIADPKHEQHDDFGEWAGDFDSEEFDAGKTTKAMRRGLPDWRQYR
ncbi:MAG: plasmid pRiA4b ORF-3 family protein [Planctomycetaceae bacterium]